MIQNSVADRWGSDELAERNVFADSDADDSGIGA
jgi:hypothetical protein